MTGAVAVLNTVDRWLARASAVAILVVMAVIVADVVGRYVFGQPLGWVYDIVAIYVINLVVYFMASETLRTGAHIALDMRVRLLPRRAWTVLQALAWAAVALALALATWRVGLSTWNAFLAGQVHPGLYEWPVWVERGIVALGLALLLLRILLRLARFCLTGSPVILFGRDEELDADQDGTASSGSGGAGPGGPGHPPVRGR